MADGDLVAVATCGTCAVNAELYEVADYATGPIPGFRLQNILVHGGWAGQSAGGHPVIISGEGRAHTQRELAKAEERDVAGLQELTSHGMSYADLPLDFKTEVRNLMALLADVDKESARALGLR